MYQYSLAWFMGLFRLGIQNATASEVLAERLKNIIDYFTFSIYQNVCRSLFEKHKLLFSFLLCVRIMQGDDKIDSEEFKFLLSGPPSTKTDGDNPAPEWMTINSWTEFSNMHFELPHFEGVTDIVREHKDSFKQMFDSAVPEEFEFPGALEERLSKFQRLLILRAMRMDKVTEGVQVHPSPLLSSTTLLSTVCLQPLDLDVPAADPLLQGRSGRRCLYLHVRSRCRGPTP